jgi:citrate synthase
VIIKSSINVFEKKAIKNNSINESFYSKHSIKRGLRNEDGTGVKAILTKISNVEGYNKVKGKVVPIHGRLIYRGYKIKNLVKEFEKKKIFGFEPTAYLLMFGELPTRKELESFQKELVDNRELPEGFVRHIILPFPSRNLMNELQTAVNVLYTTDKRSDDISLQNVIKQCIGLIAKFPTIIAHSYQAKKYKVEKKSLFIHEPNPELSTAENFLYMLREDMKFTQLEAEVLDMMLVIHADHSGGNNSTFTNHCVSSSGTDTYSAISASLASLKGPKHGGANAKVMAMMDEIKVNVKNWNDKNKVKEYLKKILTKKAFDGSGLVYGMGHAVYKKTDPRAVLLEKKAKALAKEKGRMKEYNLYQSIAELTPMVMSELKGRKVEIKKQEIIQDEKDRWKKKVKISSDEHVEDALTVYSDIVETEIENIKIYWKQEDTYLEFKAFDKNQNGLIERISWIVTHLSEQDFEIIVDITGQEDASATNITISEINNTAGGIS